MVFMKLAEIAFVPLDGPQEAWGKRNIQSKRTNMPLSSFISSVHIDHVANYLEYIE